MASTKRWAKTQGPIKREVPEHKTPAVKTDVVPEGSAELVLDWVSGDKRRAEAALKVEKKSDNSRSSLITSLQRLVDAGTGVGVTTNEA